jgi:hypothetical protein
MALSFIGTAVEKVEEFFPVFVEHFKDNVTKSLIESLDTLKERYPERWKEVSAKWRTIVTSVEPHLAPASSFGGRRKRTLKKKHRKH